MSQASRLLLPAVIAVAIAAHAGAQETRNERRPAAEMVHRILENAVSEAASTRDLALELLHRQQEIAGPAAKQVAALLAPPRTEVWPWRARMASALMLGARDRIDAHVEGGGKADDQIGLALVVERADLSQLLFPLIREAMNDAAPAVRAEAIRDVGSFSRDAADLVPALAKVVADPAEPVATRTNAATALRRLRGLAREALPALCDALDPKPEPFSLEVTGAIADILNGLSLSASKDGGEKASTKVELSEDDLEKLRRQCASAVLGKLKQLVRSDNGDACWNAAVAIGWLGDEGRAAAPDLLAAANVSYGEALVNALWALDQFRWLELPASALPALKRALDIGPDSAREHAGLLLAGLARNKVDISTAGDLLLRQAKSSHPGLVRASMRAFENMGPSAKPWAEGIASVLPGPGSDASKTSVLDALVAVDPKRIEDVALLRRLLAHEDFWTHRTAMRALAASGRLDASLEDAFIAAVRENANRWGPGGCARDLADVADGLKPSPKLAAVFLELARSGEGSNGEWIPPLRATGVPQATLFEIIERALVAPFHYQDAKAALRMASVAGLDGDALIRFYADHIRAPKEDVSSAAIDILKELGPKAASAVPALWDAQLAELAAVDAAASRGSHPYAHMSALGAIRDIAGVAGMLPRLHEEIARRSGHARRELFRYADDPGSAQTAAEMRALLASADVEDRTLAIHSLSSMPAFPGRVEVLESIAAKSGEDADAARMVLRQIAPDSPGMAKAMLVALQSGDERTALDALSFLERAADPPPAFETVRLGLLGSAEPWTFEAVCQSLDRRRPAAAPAAAALPAFAQAAKTREQRLLAAWSAAHAVGPVPAAFFDAAAPWLEWKDPNVASMLLVAAGRNAARASAIAARMPAFVAGRPSAPFTQDEERRRPPFEHELLQASKLAATLFGPMGADAAKALHEAIVRDGGNASWSRRMMEATAAPPRVRAKVTVHDGEPLRGAPNASWGAVPSPRSRPEPRPAALPDGSHRFIVDDGGEKSVTWIEVFVSAGTSGEPVWEILVNRFDPDASPAVKPLRVEQAEIMLLERPGAPWAAAPVLAGAFSARGGGDAISGTFAVRNPLIVAAAPAGGERR